MPETLTRSKLETLSAQADRVDAALRLVTLALDNGETSAPSVADWCQKTVALAAQGAEKLADDCDRAARECEQNAPLKTLDFAPLHLRQAQQIAYETGAICELAALSLESHMATAALALGGASTLAGRLCDSLYLKAGELPD